tara:strand:+ start:26571 stop:27866 length:1296 start_codon:yes stop_codon:yes gene_type:complete
MASINEFIRNSISKRDFKDMSSFSIGVSLSTFFIFLLNILIANNLTKVEVGLFFLLAAFLNILLVLSMHGLQQSWIRFVEYPVKNKDTILKDYFYIFLITIFWCFLFFLLFVFIFNSFLYTKQISNFGLILFLTFLFGSILFETILIKYQLALDFKKYGFLVAVPNFIRLSFSIIAIFLYGNLESILFSNFLSCCLLIIISCMLLRDPYWVQVKDFFKVFELNDFVGSFLDFLGNNRKFLTINLLFVFHTQTPILYSSVFIDIETTANLGAAYTIFLGLYFLPNLIIQRYIFPLLAHQKKEKENIFRNIKFKVLLILSFGFLITAVGFLLSDILFYLIFPESFRNSSIIFSIIMLSLPFKLLVAYLVNLTVLSDKTKELNKMVFLGLILNLVLFLVMKNLLSTPTLFFSLTFFEIILLIAASICLNRKKTC